MQGKFVVTMVFQDSPYANGINVYELLGVEGLHSLSRKPHTFPFQIK
ncbi:hypothetical protein RHORCCE3_1998 [Rickettsia hoogstraalii str. RCCE3]|nr:hypothetical protein RHORCCE3_1998 [Rickettsia hoogstraalii str. RCCE3]